MAEKIAVIINFNKEDWLGGYNYFKNFFKFLKKFQKKYEPVLILDKISRLNNDNFFSNFKIIVTPFVSNQNLFLKIFNKALIIVFGKSFLLENFYLKNQIKILTHSGYLGRNSQIKNFPWFPDFQELHFPDNFSLKQRILRRINLLISYKNSTNILISSDTVMNDLKKISYAAYKKAKLIKHTVDIPERKKILSKNLIKKKFKIANNFFYLPNAYWKHKNHILVLKALKFLKVKPLIVSTGKFYDHRNPKHSEYILDIIKKFNLGKYYKHLGIVSENEMYSLLYHSLALINPSKSEGWSNTVEQAKVMRKTVLLSNNNVHKEQKCKNFYYFNADDYKSLSYLLKNHSKTKHRNHAFEKLNIYEVKKNQKNFIDNFLKIITESQSKI
jgi:hypothetical protein